MELVFPLKQQSQWVGFSQNAPQLQIILMNESEIVRQRVLPILRDGDWVMDDPRPELLGVNYMEFMDLTLNVAAISDLHLFDGNTKVLYRSVTTNVQHHVYDIIQDASDDISMEQCDEIKRSAPDLVAVVGTLPPE